MRIALLFLLLFPWLLYIKHLKLFHDLFPGHFQNVFISIFLLM